MTDMKPWVNDLNISKEEYEEWLAALPPGENITHWALQNQKIPSDIYLKWARNHYGLPSLKSKFLDEPPPAKFWRKIAPLAEWPDGIIPLGSWNGVVFIACLEPPAEMHWQFQIQYILIDPRDLVLLSKSFYTVTEEPTDLSQLPPVPQTDTHSMEESAVTEQSAVTPPPIDDLPATQVEEPELPDLGGDFPVQEEPLSETPLPQTEPEVAAVKEDSGLLNLDTSIDLNSMSVGLNEHTNSKEVSEQSEPISIEESDSLSIPPEPETGMAAPAQESPTTHDPNLDDSEGATVAISLSAVNPPGNTDAAPSAPDPMNDSAPPKPVIHEVSDTGSVSPSDILSHEPLVESEVPTVDDQLPDGFNFAPEGMEQTESPTPEGDLPDGFPTSDDAIASDPVGLDLSSTADQDVTAAAETSPTSAESVKSVDDPLSDRIVAQDPTPEIPNEAVTAEAPKENTTSSIPSDHNVFEQSEDQTVHLAEQDSDESVARPEPIAEHAPEPATTVNVEPAAEPVAEIDTEAPVAVTGTPAAQPVVRNENDFNEVAAYGPGGEKSTPGESFQSAANQGEVMGHLVKKLNEFHRYSIILLSDSSQLTPWKWNNYMAAHEPSQIEPISLSKPSIFRIVSRSKLPFYGKVYSSEVNDGFFKLWGFSECPEHATVCPITSEGFVIGVVLAFGLLENPPDDLLDRTVRHVEEMTIALHKSKSAA